METPQAPVLAWNSLKFHVVADDDERLVDVPDDSVLVMEGGNCLVGRTLWARLEPELQALRRH